jgi:hypothetical protein
MVLYNQKLGCMHSVRYNEYTGNTFRRSSPAEVAVPGPSHLFPTLSLALPMTRSLRPRKARLLPTVNDASDSGEESVSKPFHKPVKWKTNENKDDDHKGLSKTSARGKIPRGRVGKLAQLPHMPLEILFEVCYDFLIIRPLSCCPYTYAYSPSDIYLSATP